MGCLHGRRPGFCLHTITKTVMRRFAIILTSVLLSAAGFTAAAQEYVPTPVTVSSEKVKLNGKVYLSHVVLERQTLYGIAAAYGVKVDDIYEANPSLRETGLRKNAIILIPITEEAAPVKQSTTQGKYTEHTVKWYEDIDDIARKYNVTVADIMQFNGLTSKKLSTRQVIRIPLPDTPLVPQEEPKVEEVPAAEETVEQEAPVEEQKDTVSALEFVTPYASPKEIVDLSLVLPIHASGRVSELNMDFYSGVLMAMKDFEKEGVKVNLNVYDLMAGIPPIDALTGSDMVLGPVASRDIEAILQRVEGKVPVISPLDQKASALAANYSNFIQAPTPADSQYNDLALWVKEDCTNADRIILITEKGGSSASAAIAIRSALAREELTYDILNYAIVEGTGIPSRLSELMTKDGMNRVIAASESEAFIDDVVRNLGIMQGKGYPIAMYAPSKVRTFDTIEPAAYHNVNLHISTSYFVDYSDHKVDSFVRSYRSLFNAEPSQFAFQGYDTARYFVDICRRYGTPHWPSFLEIERGRGLHTDFLFDADQARNHQNKAVRRIIYEKDYTTSLTK